MSSPPVICVNCKAQHDFSLALCPSCGAPNPAIHNAANQSGPVTGSQPPFSGQPPPLQPLGQIKGPSANVKLIVGIVGAFGILAVIGLIAFLFLASYSKHRNYAGEPPIGSETYLTSDTGLVSIYVDEKALFELLDHASRSQGRGRDSLDYMSESLRLPARLASQGRVRTVEEGTTVKIVSYDTFEPSQQRVVEVLIETGQERGSRAWVPAFSVATKK